MISARSVSLLFKHFWLSVFLTCAGVLGVALALGFKAMLVTIILIAVELAFSFDNAVINAGLLSKFSPLWRKLFLTVGIVIAVLGMRAVFPIMIVAISAHLGWTTTLDLALHHPSEYAEKLQHAHVTIAAFGAGFLLMLALKFFIEDEHPVLWLRRIEARMRRLANLWAAPLISFVAVATTTLLPANHHKQQTIVAGVAGIATYVMLHLVTMLFAKIQKAQTSGVVEYVGMAAFISFIYLEVLDASFSFDGVIGAFAITNEVILIAIGLGIGALWVRSLSVFMVEHQTLKAYKYLEHGAHYAVAALAAVLLVSIIIHVPDVIAGLLGIGLIGASLAASRRAIKEAAQTS